MKPAVAAVEPVTKDTTRFQIQLVQFCRGGVSISLLSEIASLAEHFKKDRPTTADVKRLRREDLELICFEYVSA